jgi:hypothetical protein
LHTTLPLLHPPFDITAWTLHPNAGFDFPAQPNSYDCGIYVLMVADVLAADLPVSLLTIAAMTHARTHVGMGLWLRRPPDLRQHAPYQYTPYRAPPRRPTVQTTITTTQRRPNESPTTTDIPASLPTTSPPPAPTPVPTADTMVTTTTTDHETPSAPNHPSLPPPPKPLRRSYPHRPPSPKRH